MIKGMGQVANITQGEAKYYICHEIPPGVLNFIIQLLHKYMVLLLGLLVLCGRSVYFLH